MKKNVLFVISCFAVLISCTKSNSNDEDIKSEDVKNENVVQTPKMFFDGSEILPKSIIYSNGNTKSKDTLIYKENKIYRIVQDNKSYHEFTYSDDIISKICYYSENKNLIMTVDYTYNAQKKIIETKLYYEDGDYIAIEKYNYSTDGTIKIIGTTNDDDYYEDIYTFSNGNLMQITEKSTEENTIYEYDKNNNPFKNILGLDKLTKLFFLSPYSGSIYYSANNATKITASNNSDYFPSSITENTIKYNDDLFPILSSSKEKTIDGNRITELYYTISFLY